MAEKETIYSSKIKSSGLFPYSDFYRFCYEYLSDELGFSITEDTYSEKIKGESKDIDIIWSGSRKVTDYFKFSIKVKFRIIGMTNVEVTQDGVKKKMNKGNVEIKMSSTLVRDYQGKFEQNAFQKFLRAIYEKWVIPSRVSQYEDKLAGDSDDFLGQIKAYLDLEGKR
jgi:hypothetical protein